MNPNEYVPAAMVSPPLVNNMYHNQVQHPHLVLPSIIQHSGYVIPPNMVCYASPPIQPPYSQPILIPAAHYYSVVTTQQMATNVTHSDPTVMQHNGSVQLPIENDDVNELANAVNDDLNIASDSPDDDLVPELIGDEQAVVSQPQAVMQNGLKTTSSPSVGKSWASLFNNSNTATQQNGFAQNNDVNIAKAKPVVENQIVDTVCPIKHPKKVIQFVDPDCYRMGGK